MALAVLAGCSKPASNPLLGYWVEDKTDPESYLFKSDGTFVDRLPGPGTPGFGTRVGRYDLAGNRLLLYDVSPPYISMPRMASTAIVYLTRGSGWIRFDSLQLYRGGRPATPMPASAPASIVGTWVEDSYSYPVRIVFRADGTFAQNPTGGGRKPYLSAVITGKYTYAGGRLREYDVQFETFRQDGRRLAHGTMPNEAFTMVGGPGWMRLGPLYFHADAGRDPLP